MRDMPRIYPDFLAFDRRSRHAPAEIWKGCEWTINLRVDSHGQITSALVLCYRDGDGESGVIGQAECDFGPFDPLQELLRDAMISSAIHGAQLPLW